MAGSIPARRTMDDFEIRELNFSQFHALDHVPGSPYCWTQYGGLRIHLKYGWDLRWRGWILCPLGRHRWANWRNHLGDTSVQCWFCAKDKGT